MSSVNIHNATGGAGGEVVGAGVTKTGNFLSIFFVDSSTLDVSNLEGNIANLAGLSGVSFTPGTHLVGRFTKVALASGKAILYNHR